MSPAEIFIMVVVVLTMLLVLGVLSVGITRGRLASRDVARSGRPAKRRRSRRDVPVGRQIPPEAEAEVNAGPVPDPLTQRAEVSAGEYAVTRRGFFSRPRSLWRASSCSSWRWGSWPSSGPS